MNIWLLAIEATVSWYPTAEKYYIKIAVQILPPALATELMSLGVSVPPVSQVLASNVFSKSLFCVSVHDSATATSTVISKSGTIFKLVQCQSSLHVKCAKQSNRLLTTTTTRQDESRAILRA